MANAVGLAVGIAISIVLLSLQSLTHLSLWIEVLIVIAVAGVNLLVWVKSALPPLSFGRALKELTVGVAIVVMVGVVDILIGGVITGTTVFDALLGSGMFGDVVDNFLGLMLVLVGVPTLARSVWLYHHFDITSKSDEA